MLRADIYIRPKGTFVLAQHVTETELGISGEPRVKLPADSDAAALGEAVLACMGGSREGVESPADFRTFRKDFFKFLGCSSQKALEKDSFHACVFGDQQSVTVRPSRVAKTGGFEPLINLEVSCPAMAVDVGKHILNLREQITGTAE